MGGLCFACSDGWLPCRNALRGCFKHVRRKRRITDLAACTSHGTLLCPFDPRCSSTVCSMPWCGHERQTGIDKCELCGQGLSPCAGKCGRRTTIGNKSRCEYCLDDGAPPFLENTLPTQYCGTATCQNVVADTGVCWHCSTGSLPCEVEGCTGRTPDSTQVRCEGCISTVSRVRLSRKAPSKPCKYAARSCTGSVPAHCASTPMACNTCRQSGPPCIGISIWLTCGTLWVPIGLASLLAF